jgi:hypothetical protein
MNKKLKNILGGTLAVASFVPYLFVPEVRGMLTSPRSNINEQSNIERIVDENEDMLHKPLISQSNNNVDYADYIANHEGFKTRVYCARNPREKNRNKFIEPTIGIGHYMDRGDSKETFARVLPHVDWDEVYSGKRNLTSDEAKVLFDEDLKSYVERTKKTFDNFDSYPPYVQKVLIDGFYRGCLSGSPKTIKLINDGKFSEASREYLNHDEYRNSTRNGMGGVKRRMENNSKVFRKYAQEKHS